MSNIANAGAHCYVPDALTLSGETTQRQHPVEAIATMSRWRMEMERSVGPHRPTVKVEADQTSFLRARLGVDQSSRYQCAILTDSYTGRTASDIFSGQYRASYPTLYHICYYPYVVRLLAQLMECRFLYQPPAGRQRGYICKNALTHLVEASVLHWPDRIAYLGVSVREAMVLFLEINSVEAIMENFQSYTLPNLEDASLTAISRTIYTEHIDAEPAVILPNGIVLDGHVRCLYSNISSGHLQGVSLRCLL